MFKWRRKFTAEELTPEMPFYPFNQLTNYFHEKYSKDGDDPAFALRAEHFFSALKTVLEGQPAPGLETIPHRNVPSVKRRYERAYGAAFNVGRGKIGEREVTSDQVAKYFIDLANYLKDPMVRGEERSFYQHFFVNFAFPILFSTARTQDKNATLIMLRKKVSESSLGCAALFGILDPVVTKRIFSKSECIRVQQTMQGAEAWIMDFIIRCLYPEKSDDLLAKCGAVCRMSNTTLALEIAKGVDLYLKTRLNLYPEIHAEKRQLFESCINQFRSQFIILGELISVVDESGMDKIQINEGVELTTIRNHSSIFCQPVRPESRATTTSDSPTLSKSSGDQG